MTESYSQLLSNIIQIDSNKINYSPNSNILFSLFSKKDSDTNIINKHNTIISSFNQSYQHELLTELHKLNTYESNKTSLKKIIKLSFEYNILLIFLSLKA